MDLHKLFTDVFHPEPDETVAIIADVPHGELRDHQAWQERREMAAEWRAAWVSLGEQIGFDVLPLITFPATGTHNGNLPLDNIPLRDGLARATIVNALTQFSATAPLSAWARSHSDFRAASLPGVARRMEETALSADYSEVARRCQILMDTLSKAEYAQVSFTTGHKWTVDLRFREAHKDDGQLPREKANSAFPIINLPSGESFQVPYEGERDGEPSRTEGEIHVSDNGDIIVFRVENNRIVDIEGKTTQAARLKAYFNEDPMRANIAEFALGCNPKAVVWGNVLEDEKAGFHWAYGRSEHLGGTIGPEHFKSPAHIVHEDIVYAKDSPIQVASLLLISADGKTREIIQDSAYLV